MKSGTWVILWLLLVATLAAGLVWWWRWSTVDDLMARIGSERIATIETSPRVQMLKLTKLETDSDKDMDDNDGEQLAILENTFRVTGSRDLSAQPELLHMRHAFATDVSYKWGRYSEDLYLEAQEANWIAAIRFGEGDKTTTLAIAPAESLVYVVETDTILDARYIADALKDFEQRYVKE